MLKNYIQSTSGNISVVFALSLGIVGLVVAAAIDLTNIQSVEASMQDALDNATVLAAKIHKEDDFEENSVFFFSSNFEEPKNSTSLTVQFDADKEEIIGTATLNVPLMFGGVLDLKVVNIKAKSVIKLVQSKASPCIIALSTTASPGILINSGAKINAPNCSVQSNSELNSSMTVNGGTNLNVKKFCVAGSNIINNTGGEISGLETDCETESDPYSGRYPVPDSTTCDYNHGNFSEMNISLSPGVYCGWFNFNNSNSNVTFAPGLYVLKNGGWNVNGGRWSGDGITFYYADNSKIQFNSGVSASFTAPVSGDYSGVFMTETANPFGGRSSFILNDSRGFEFEGVMYLPNRRVTFNSGSSFRSYTMDLVADTFIINAANLELESSNKSVSGSTDVVYMSE